MTWEELELLLLLSAGDTIEVRNRLTDWTLHGTVDLTAPGLGKLWMFAELGERKLIDIDVHTISRRFAV